MELLLASNLLAQFLPEMLPMVGCTQGNWHRYDVWTHTLAALENLPDSARGWKSAWPALARCGQARDAHGNEDEAGVHFYGHPAVGAEIDPRHDEPLKFPNDEIRDVTALVDKHMRLGEYRPDWTDASVKRLIRDCGPYLDDLFTLTRCDQWPP